MTEKEKNNVEEIQNFVEKALKDEGHKDIAVAYSGYEKKELKLEKLNQI